MSGSSIDPSEGPIIRTHAQIYHVELVHAEISKVVMNCPISLLARESVRPGLVVSPARADLSDNHQTVRDTDGVPAG